MKHFGTLRLRNIPFKPTASAIGFYECPENNGYIIINKMYRYNHRLAFTTYIDHLMKNQMEEYMQNKELYRKKIQEITSKYGSIEKIRSVLKTRYKISKKFDYSLKQRTDRLLGIGSGIILNNEDYYEQIKDKSVDHIVKAYFELTSTLVKSRTNFKKEDLDLVDRCMAKNSQGIQIGSLWSNDVLIFKIDKEKNIQFLFKCAKCRDMELRQQFKIRNQTFDKFYALLLRRYYPNSYY